MAPPASALQQLPLRSLLLCECSNVRSLAFLGAGTLPATLTDLRLHSCNPRLPSIELQHVLPLRVLKELSLNWFFKQLPTAEERAPFQLPSKRFPALRTVDIDE